MRSTLVIAALLAASPAALAADLKVGKGKQFTTIQSAVAAAHDGDRVLVGPGVYRENVTFIGLSNMQFIGKGAVWDGHTATGHGVCLYGTGDGTVVQGFKFRNGSGHVAVEGAGTKIVKCVSRGAMGTAFNLIGDGCRIEKCEVVGASSGSAWIMGSGATVLGNRIRNTDNEAIYVNGTSARVEKNSVRTVEDDVGIDVVGEDAQVLANTVFNTDDQSIYVSGSRAKVVGNKCSYTANGAGIEVIGSAVEVASNAVVAPEEAGFSVIGDDVSVHDNTVSMTSSPSVGIHLVSMTSAGGGSLANNVVKDTMSWGFLVESNNVAVSSNTAVNCGTAADGGFYLRGDSLDVSACVATACRWSGFVVVGDSNQVTGCVATKCDGDGFRVFGQAVQLKSLKATGNGGEGLDNRGVLTKATGCTLTGNRLDVACDVTSGASFDGGLAGNTFRTGGITQQPEFDN